MIYIMKGNPSRTLSGKLLCPTCRSQKIKEIGRVGPYMIRYRCKECNLTFKYDMSNRYGGNSLKRNLRK